MSDVRLDDAKLRALLRQAARKSAEQAGQGLVRSIKAGISKRATGEAGSSPGQPPAQRTGELRRGVSYKVTEAAGEVVLTVGVEADYALHLEFGTKHAKARPFLRGRFRAYLRTARNQLQRNIRALLKGPSGG